MTEREEWVTQEKPVGTIGWFLERKFHEFSMRYPGRFKSQVQFATWLGVKQSTFNTWWNNSKVPKGEVVDQLADKLGPEIYHILNLKPRTVHKRVQLIDMVWDRLPKDTQDEWYEKAQEIAEEDQDSELRGKRSRATG